MDRYGNERTVFEVKPYTGRTTVQTGKKKKNLHRATSYWKSPVEGMDRRWVIVTVAPADNKLLFLDQTKQKFKRVLCPLDGAKH